MKQPGAVQRLIAVARMELLLIIGVVAKLAAALLLVEGLTWLAAVTPAFQPPIAMTAMVDAAKPHSVSVTALQTPNETTPSATAR